MNRVNIYGFPHKGLRNALGQLSLKAGAVNVNSPQEVSELVALTDEVSELLDIHLRVEEDFILPPVEEKVPGSTSANREDHLAMERLEKEMVAKAHGLSDNPGVPAAAALYHHVNLFIREYFRHMDDEETDMNKVIWDNFEDHEILSWQGRILATFTPEQFSKWFRYIIPALLPEEQRIMLGGFKQNATSEVFSKTIDGLKPYLTQNQIIIVSSI